MISPIQIVHIGGRGGVGPVGRLYHLAPSIELSVVEADTSDSRWGSYEHLQVEHSVVHGFSLHVVKACIWGHEDPIEFHVKKDIRASSLFDTHPLAENYCKWSATRTPRLFPWGEASRTVSTMEMHATTITCLVEKKILPVPNLLSMDIQGSEYQALLGSRSLLHDPSFLAVISECHFRPMYEGEGTFSDISSLLLSFRMPLFSFLSLEEWWEEVITDRGFPLVAECLFMKDYRAVDAIDDLLKLSAIAYTFQHSSHGYLAARKAISMDRKCLNDESDPLIAFLRREYTNSDGKIAEFNAIAARGKENP